jgi:hypothetical protein
MVRIFYLFVQKCILFGLSRSQLRNALPRRKIFLGVLKRSATLFFLGLVLNSGGKTDLRTLRIPGVMQRFAATFLVAGTLEAAFMPRQERQQISDILSKNFLTGFLRNFKQYWHVNHKYEKHCCSKLNINFYVARNFSRNLTLIFCLIALCRETPEPSRIQGWKRHFLDITTSVWQVGFDNSLNVSIKLKFTCLPLFTAGHRVRPAGREPLPDSSPPGAGVPDGIPGSGRAAPRRSAL